MNHPLLIKWKKNGANKNHNHATDAYGVLQLCVAQLYLYTCFPQSLQQQFYQTWSGGKVPLLTQKNNKDCSSERPNNAFVKVSFELAPEPNSPAQFQPLLSRESQPDSCFETPDSLSLHMVQYQRFKASKGS